MLPHNYSFSAIGTAWQIDSVAPLSDVAKQAIAARIEQFDAVYSRFQPGSLVRQMAESGGTYHFPDDVIPLIRVYRQLYELTGGQVTPLIGATLERAGYDAAYSLIPQPQQAPVPEWDAVMHWEASAVTTSAPLLLDVGAAGKGYLIDLLVPIIAAQGIDRFVIDASGDVYVHDATPQVIGLEDPGDATQVIGTMTVANGSLCASATNRRRWGGDLHHVFHPTTQTPVSEVVATWVSADTALLADGLATALFFVPPARLLPHYAFQYVRMLNDGIIEYSQDLKGEIFS